jgi:hypothetical protein
MESAGLEPVTRTFGTTVVKDDALAAYATYATTYLSSSQKEMRGVRTSRSFGGFNDNMRVEHSKASEGNTFMMRMG